MAKNPVSFGQGALILLRLKLAIEATGLREPFVAELENMRQNLYPAIPYNIDYKFSEPAWLNILEDRIDFEAAQENKCAEDRAARHAQVQLDNLKKAAENLNAHDEGLSKDQRSDLSDLLVEFHAQITDCKIAPPSSGEAVSEDPTLGFECRMASQALMYSYVGQHYQNW